MKKYTLCYFVVTMKMSMIAYMSMAYMSMVANISLYSFWVNVCHQSPTFKWWRVRHILCMCKLVMVRSRRFPTPFSDDSNYVGG